MDAKDLERHEWLGVLGAGAIAAIVSALAMPGPAQSQPQPAVVVERSHVVVVDTLKGSTTGTFQEQAQKRVPPER